MEIHKAEIKNAVVNNLPKNYTKQLDDLKKKKIELSKLTSEKNKKRELSIYYYQMHGEAFLPGILMFIKINKTYACILAECKENGIMFQLDTKCEDFLYTDNVKILVMFQQDIKNLVLRLVPVKFIQNAPDESIFDIFFNPLQKIITFSTQPKKHIYRVHSELLHAYDKRFARSLKAPYIIMTTDSQQRVEDSMTFYCEASSSSSVSESSEDDVLGTT